ncbi:hypothetical protein SUGI_1201990 [Cryptomeria japonica]|nr:hypothetical protein SUGI_1201990 [Cryptomeria japonica]
MASIIEKRCIILFSCFVLLIAASQGRTEFMQPQNRDGDCEEIYTVEEGESLQTISEKCNAPFILMDNPHIQDTDDLSQGLVLKITSLNTHM